MALYKAEIAHKSHPPLGDIVNIDGKIAHVMIMGTGEDLVLIHGSSGNIRDFTLSIAASLAKDFRVIMIDRPGLGYSKSFNKSGETLKEQAIFLYQVAKTFGANKPIVLGHSLGGAVALAWAVYLPNNISGLLPLSAVSNRWPGGTSAFYKINKNFILNKFSVPIISAFAPKRKIESDVKEVFNPQEVPSNFLKEFGRLGQGFEICCQSLDHPLGHWSFQPEYRPCLAPRHGHCAATDRRAAVRGRIVHRPLAA